MHLKCHPDSFTKMRRQSPQSETVRVKIDNTRRMAPPLFAARGQEFPAMNIFKVQFTGYTQIRRGTGNVCARTNAAMNANIVTFNQRASFAEVARI